MKKRGARDIPDFSKKRSPSSTTPGQAPAPGGSAGRPPVPPAAPKPKATSSKSGRRGG